MRAEVAGRNLIRVCFFFSGISSTCAAEMGSENFDDFLQVLGDRVTLKGWDRFRGGLDVKGESKWWPISYVPWCGCRRRWVNCINLQRNVDWCATMWARRQHDRSGVRLHNVRGTRNHVSRVDFSAIFPG